MRSVPLIDIKAYRLVNNWWNVYIQYIASSMVFFFVNLGFISIFYIAIR